MDFFGLDIGSHKIKLVQLARKEDKFQLVAFGFAPSTQKGLLSEAESDLIAVSEVIKKLCLETKVKTKNVVTALPQDQVFTRIITLPKLSEEELTSALKWEAEQYVPIPLEEVILSHQIVGEIKENGKEKIEVLLAAAPINLVNKVIKVLETAGLNPASLEIEIISVARSLVPPKSEITMLVDLGSNATDLAIVENSQVVFVHSISTAGAALTRAVAFELGLDPDQAEAYKKAYGVDPEKLEGKVKSAIGPVLDVIVKEMENTIQFFQTKEKNVKQVILTGGTAGLPEVASLMAKKLNLEIQIGDPFSQVTLDGMVNTVPAGDSLLYAAAVGLAMKEME